MYKFVHMALVSIPIAHTQYAIDRAKTDYGPDKVNAAIRMALNDGARRSRTEVRKGIQQIYTIKSARILDSNPKKGLSIRFATDNNLEADLIAGHSPVNLSEVKIKTTWTTANYKAGDTAYSVKKNGKLQKAKRSVGLISVEVFKGNSKQLLTAFIPGTATSARGTQFITPAIFARGKRGTPDFKFSTDNKRYPIDTLSTVSIFTAALNAKTQGVYLNNVNTYTVSRLMRNLERLGSS